VALAGGDDVEDDESVDLSHVIHAPAPVLVTL